MSSGVSLEQDAVVWCRACGIPHDAGTVYCSFCSQPLLPLGAEVAATVPGDGEAASAPSVVAADAQTGVLARAIAERAAQGRTPRQRPTGRWTIARRPTSLTDDEIEAQAAAIVALARAEEAAGINRPQPTAADGSGLLDQAEVFAQLDFLPPLRERDRLWLIAGLFCCALLIIAAIGIVRFFAQ